MMTPLSQAFITLMVSAALVLLGGGLLSASAFVPTITSNALRKYQLDLIPTKTFESINCRSRSLFMAQQSEDDDEEDEDDEEGDEEDPLANGIDSVTWLPSLANQSTKTITAVKNVSF